MSTTPITNDTGAPSPSQTPVTARSARWSAVGGYLRLELSRTFRDGRYLLLAVVAPVGFYLLFSAVFGGSSSGPNTTFGLPAATEIMVAMATFGAMWAALSATAPRLARDREGGWSDYLATTPLRAGQVLAGRITAGLVVALPAVVAVGIAAVAAHGVSLPVWRWAADLGLLWIGTLPFVALGIAIGSLANSTVAFAASTGLWFAFAALGGLWAAAGAGRLVRFRLLRGDPERFAATTGVTALSAAGDRVTLRTADADATVWALYPERYAIADIGVAEASLEEAFLSLVASRADGTGAGGPPGGLSLNSAPA